MPTPLVTRERSDPADQRKMHVVGVPAEDESDTRVADLLEKVGLCDISNAPPPNDGC